MWAQDPLLQDPPDPPAKISPSLCPHMHPMFHALASPLPLKHHVLSHLWALSLLFLLGGILFSALTAGPMSSYYFSSLFIYCEREQAWVGEGQRKRERENQKQVLGTVGEEPNMGFDPTNHEIMMWAEINGWGHPGAPPMSYYLRLSLSTTYLQRLKTPTLLDEVSVLFPGCSHAIWTKT